MRRQMGHHPGNSSAGGRAALVSRESCGWTSQMPQRPSVSRRLRDERPCGDRLAPVAQPATTHPPTDSPHSGASRLIDSLSSHITPTRGPQVKTCEGNQSPARPPRRLPTPLRPTQVAKRSQGAHAPPRDNGATAAPIDYTGPGARDFPAFCTCKDRFLLAARVAERPPGGRHASGPRATRQPVGAEHCNPP